MAQNYDSDGDVIPYTNTTGAAIASGQVVVIGHILGIALVAIAIGATGSVAVSGVWTVPKVAGAVFEQGEKLIWDTSGAAFDDSAATPAAGDITGGAVAWAAGSNGQATALVKLTPGNTTKTA